MDIGRIMNVCDVVCVNIHVVDCFVCLCLVPMKVHSILALVAAAGCIGCEYRPDRPLRVPPWEIAFLQSGQSQ